MRGLTLIELIAFIVIVGAGVAGVLSVYQNIAATNADPMVRKQQLAIAESLLLEIEQQAFTYCDQSDANFETAVSGVGCATAAHNQDTLGAAGPANGKARDQYDNVGNYHGLKLNNKVTDLGGNAAVEGYSAEVTITQVGDNAAFSGLAGITKNDVLRIEVSVTGPAAISQPVRLVGYRARYAPHSP